MDKILQVNYSDQTLFCVYCKEKINIGEKYITVFEELYNGEEIDKPYHIQCEQLDNNDA